MPREGEERGSGAIACSPGVSCYRAAAMRGGLSSTNRTTTGFGHPVLNFLCYGLLICSFLYPLKVVLPERIGTAAAAAAESRRIADFDGLASTLLVASPFSDLLAAMDARVPGAADRALVRHLLAAWWAGALFTIAGAVPLLLIRSVREQVGRSLPRGGARFAEAGGAALFLVVTLLAFRAGHFWFTPGAKRMALLDGVGLGLPIVLSAWAVVRLFSLAGVALLASDAAAERRSRRPLDFSRSPRAAARWDFVCSACGASIDAAPFWSGIEIRCPACGQPTTLRFSGSGRRYEITYDEFRQLLTDKGVRDAVSPVLVMRLRCSVVDDGKTLVLKGPDGEALGLRQAHLALQSDEAMQKWIHGLAEKRWR
jgi:predicted RNA-binding Zn-ribbon protein involved in translation (DUF1610 family)